MRKKLIWILPLLLIASAAHADKVYRWVDAQGQVHYADHPHVGAKAVQISPLSGGQTTPPTSAAENGKGDDAQTRTALCAEKKKQLDGYRHASKIVETDNLGHKHVYSTQEQIELIKRTKAAVQQLCSSE